jgi:hypothetical protein
LSENLAGLSIITTPLIRAGISPQTACNFVVLLSWPLSALGCHLLCHRLTGRHDAGCLGGLVFGFAPYRLEQVAHVQVLASWWMPFGLLALHRAMDARSPRERTACLSAFVMAWVLQSFTNGYFMFYFTLFVVAWVAWFTARRSQWRIGVLVVCGLAVAALLASPVLAHYRAVHHTWHLTRPPDEIRAFSATLASFVTGPDLLALWRFRPDSRGEHALYPGLVAVVIAAGGIAASVRARNPAPTSARIHVVRYALLLAGGVLLASAVSTAFGPWHLQLGPLYIGGRQLRKPLTLGLVFCGASALLTPSARDAARRRSPLMFYALATLLCWSMCLGPTGVALTSHIIEKPPYWWLMKIPGIPELRVPARFAMVGALALAVTVALAWPRLISIWAPRRRTAAIAIVLTLLVADAWPVRLPMVPRPAALSLPVQADGASVLELPLDRALTRATAAMARGMSHRRPVVNGYSSYVPDPYGMIANALEERDESILEGLAGFGPVCVVLDTSAARAEELAAMVERSGATQLGPDGQYRFYLLRARPAPATSGPPLASIGVYAGRRPVPEVTDGRLDTFWTNRIPQRGRESLTITWVGVAEVRGLRFVQALRTGDYPRQLIVEVAREGGWLTAWQGATASLAFRAAVLDMDRTAFTIPFAPTATTAIRVRQTGRTRTAPWSVAEVEVLR